MTVPECGRGLFIIHRIMDTVRLTRQDNRNILTMTKRLIPTAVNRTDIV
jgi:anti-sigma regulatory factor (Ser/Thr protein kinase)